MKLYYREDLDKLQIIDGIKSQQRNAKIFSALLILSSILNIYNNSLNLIGYLNIALLVLLLAYGYYLIFKKSYQEYYLTEAIIGLKKRKILNIESYSFLLKNRKQRDLTLSKLKNTQTEVEEFCKQYGIPILY